MLFKNIFSLILTIALCLGCQSTKLSKLKVLSYNIRHGEGMDKKINLQRITKLLKDSQADLIALQEVDKGCSRSHQLDIAKELAESLDFHYEFTKFMDYDGGEYGMAILSRFPIKQTRRHDLPTGTEPRCALEVQVQLPPLNQPLSFICIHNEWRKAQVRNQQIKTLLTSIKSYNNPVILAGDFNGEPNDQSLQIFKVDPWQI